MRFLQRPWKRLLFAVFILVLLFITIKYLQVFRPISNTITWPENDSRMIFYAEIATSPFFTKKEALYFLNLEDKKLTSFETGLRVYYGSSWASQKQQFLLNGNSDSGSGLYLVDKNGEIIEQLERIESALDLSISPNGKSIVYSQDGELYIQNIEGNTQQRITDDSYAARRPDWSPNGQDLIFIRHYPTQDVRDIVRINKDGENLRSLIQNRNPILVSKWSPDGQMIAFSSWDQLDQHSLWIMEADGSNPRQILKSDVDHHTVYDLIWSPDSKYIIFVSEKNGYCGFQIEYQQVCTKSLYLLDVNTEEVTRLTNRWLFVTQLLGWVS